MNDILSSGRELFVVLDDFHVVHEKAILDARETEIWEIEYS